jgi:hypothetical protein
MVDSVTGVSASAGDSTVVSGSDGVARVVAGAHETSRNKTKQ